MSSSLSRIFSARLTMIYLPRSWPISSDTTLRAFERQFRATFHLTPQKFLRKLRLRIASRGLIYTDESLSDIALKCGFADQSHFSREFRRQFGRTPREYREYYKRAADV